MCFAHARGTLQQRGDRSGEEAAEGVRRADAVGQRQEGLQSHLAGAAELGDLGEIVDAAEDGQECHD